MPIVIVLHPQGDDVVDSVAEYQMHRQAEILSREPGNIMAPPATKIPKGHKKLYLQGHGSTKGISRRTPQKLAALLKERGLADSDIEQISLYACQSGVNPADPTDANGRNSVAHRLSWLLRSVKKVTVMGVRGNGWFDIEGIPGNDKNPNTRHRYRTKTRDPEKLEESRGAYKKLRENANSVWSTHKIAVVDGVMKKTTGNAAEEAAEAYFQGSRPKAVDAINHGWIYENRDDRRNYHPKKADRNCGTDEGEAPDLSG
jgi:hypothetical protein